MANPTAATLAQAATEGARSVKSAYLINGAVINPETGAGGLAIARLAECLENLSLAVGFLALDVQKVLDRGE